MKIGIDHQWRKEVCRQLGLNPELVTEVAIVIPCDDVATITVKGLLDQETGSCPVRKFVEVNDDKH